MIAMDANRVAMVLSVAALILAVPLSILGNLLTPHVRNWYATTSQQRLAKRLAELEKRFDLSSNEWTFTPAEWAAFQFQAIFVMGVIFVIADLLSSVSAGAFVLLILEVRKVGFSPTAAAYLQKIGMVVFILLLVPYLCSAPLAGNLLTRYRDCRDLHSDSGRERLKNEIDKLRALVR